MAVGKSQRALLVVSYLATPTHRWRGLYQFLQTSGEKLARVILKPKYKRYRTLVGGQATRAAFIGELAALGSIPEVEAIDVIVILHGTGEELHFHGGSASTSWLQAELRALDLKHKLRLLYNLSCYGRSHSDDSRSGGFTTSVGARRVNTTGATEFPIALSEWGAGTTIARAIEAGDNPVTRAASDAVARLLGFDADSTKHIAGTRSLRITSAAR